MTTAEQNRHAEQAAREQLRRIRKAQRAAAEAAARRWRERLLTAISDTAAAHPRCRCKLRSVRNPAELRALGSGCTAGRWVCPRLDAVRRRLG